MEEASRWPGWPLTETSLLFVGGQQHHAGVEEAEQGPLSGRGFLAHGQSRGICCSATTLG